MKTSEKMRRTLIRVVSINGVLSPLNYPQGVRVVIPGWHWQRDVYVFKQGIPPAIFKTMKEGKRYHVKCNYGAEKESDLCFDEWEKE
jgi:hypothetical protein